MQNHFQIYRLTVLYIILLLLFACSGNHYHKTSSGLEYRIYTSIKGNKAKVGDYLTLYLSYKNAEDSVFFDSHKDAAPWRFQLMKPSFQGSYEEGLTLLAAGDSASFLVSADSMFSLVFKKPLPKGIAAGSKLEFDIKLEAIETEEEALAAKRKLNEEKRNEERKQIDQYLKAHNLQITPTASGLYFLKDLKSTGAAPTPDGTCVIEYTGRFLDGREFETSTNDGHPLQIVMGQNTVIKAWEEALLMMKTGEKATIIVPSSLAYGEDGRRNAKGYYDIQPFTPLIYELKLMAVR